MISRRQFIKQSSILSTLALSNWQNAFPAKKEIGLQLYTVRSEVNKEKLPGTLKTIADAGYTHVELYGYYNREFFGYSINEMAGMLKRNGLKSYSGHYGLADFQYNKQYDFSSWNRLIEDGKKLGNKYLVIPYIDDKHRKIDDYKLLAERLNKAGELCKAAGMKAGYHNHDFEFHDLGGTSGWDILLNETDPKLVDIEMDIYWVYYSSKDPVEIFKQHPGRFPLWHVKDLSTTANNKQSTIIGTGEIDYKAIYAARKTAGLKHFIIEQEQYTKPVFDCIRESYQYCVDEVLR